MRTCSHAFPIVDALLLARSGKLDEVTRDGPGPWQMKGDLAALGHGFGPGVSRESSKSSKSLATSGF
ncbi:MAG: hypothetical protein HZC36_08715 [Armatimonadetes bacterium]|nr:hypothetical protein [Armatimonadota bacterium]